MRSKFILFFLLISSNIFAQSSAGLFFGYNFQSVIEKSLIVNYQLGYQQSFLNKIVLGASLGLKTDGESVYNIYQSSSLPIEQNVQINFDFAIADYKYFAFESKYFFNDLDESPLGAYISSNYKFTSMSINSRVNSIVDNNGTDISNTYNKLKVDELYISNYYVNSLGLKLGASTGHGLNLNVGVDYNIPFVVEDSKVSVNFSPNYNSLTYNIGLLFGFGLGY